ncbi:hypothetical protein [Catenisphaera adipataccumulans]|jgi:hypothetical protein|uniref:Uncharacterized protein n=1 Tax=Catenisphaera adipataccumulans TaxID=700500 RepID=A0A7W8FX24_9FIRM|nr:hypothetical protein [Catenisphaera adipataccumulans]MBB5182527.1 hypothetical protein [Catenisphaera adipataccumulans]
MYLYNVQKLDHRQIYADFFEETTKERGSIRMELGANKVMELTCNTVRGRFSDKFDAVMIQLIKIGTSSDYKKNKFKEKYIVR